MRFKIEILRERLKNDKYKYNVAADFIANALAQNQRMMSRSLERLSSGSRINSAADDPADLQFHQN